MSGWNSPNGPLNARAPANCHDQNSIIDIERMSTSPKRGALARPGADVVPRPRGYGGVSSLLLFTLRSDVRAAVGPVCMCTD